MGARDRTQSVDGRLVEYVTAQAFSRGSQVVSLLPTSKDLAALGPDFMNRGRRRAAFDSALVTAAVAGWRAVADVGIRA